MENEYLKKYRHAPAHLFLTGYRYFVSAGTLGRRPYFDTDSKKELLFDTICEMLEHDGGRHDGWVILSNHYHMLVELENAFLLPQLIRRIHSKSAVLLNKLSRRPGRRIWYQYWDECIRDEKSFYAKLNYIHWNPVKHGYVDSPEEYRFSSYGSHLRIRGKKWLREILRRFPPAETEKGDEF
jgi:putative transposase